MNTSEAVALFEKECRYRGLAPKTLSSYLWALRKLEAMFEELPTSPFEIMDFIAMQDLAAESSHDLWRFVRTFFRWAERRNLAVNVMGDVPPPRRRKHFPRTLEMSEIRSLLATTEDRRARAMIAMILNTGIRIGEIANLRWSDVRSDGLQVDGKSGPRTVPLSPKVLRVLMGLGDGEYVWYGRWGPLTTTGCKQLVVKAMRAAGIRPPKAGPHMLRHTFGRHYILGGGDVRSLQRILGHQDVSTSMIYVEMSNQDVSGQHEKFNPLRYIDLDNPMKEESEWSESGESG